MKSVSNQCRQGPALALYPLDYPSSQGSQLAFSDTLGLADSGQDYDPQSGLVYGLTALLSLGLGFLISNLLEGGLGELHGPFQL